VSRTPYRLRDGISQWLEAECAAWPLGFDMGPTLPSYRIDPATGKESQRVNLCLIDRRGRLRAVNSLSRDIDEMIRWLLAERRRQSF
jgi:hypothetical protein